MGISEPNRVLSGLGLLYGLWEGLLRRDLEPYWRCRDDVCRYQDNICIYVYTHNSICKHAYIYIYVYIYVYMYVCMYVCMHVCMYTYMYIYIYVSIYVG